MADPLDLAKQAMDFWEAGQLEDAAQLYEQLLLVAGPDYVDLPHYHSCYAGVLSALGRFSEAREQLQLALSAQREQDQDEYSPCVVIARYFLAEHFLQTNEPKLALETLQPSLQSGGKQQWLLLYIKALALFALGREKEARIDAQRCLKTAPSAEKQAQLQELFVGKNLL